MSRKTDELDHHIGLRLKMRRILCGLSQEDLSKMLGVTFQQIQKYEKSLNRISASRLYDIARALNVSIEYFYECYNPEAYKSSVLYLSDSETFSSAAYEDTLPNAEMLRKKRMQKNDRHDVIMRLLQIPDGEDKQKILENLQKALDDLEKR